MTEKKRGKIGLVGILFIASALLLVLAVAVGVRYFQLKGGAEHVSSTGDAQATAPTPTYDTSGVAQVPDGDIEAAMATDRIFDGIYIDGVDMGGKTYAEAQQALAELDKKWSGALRLALNIGGTEETLGADRFSTQTDSAAVLDEAYAIGRSLSTARENYARVQALKTEPERFEVKRTVTAIDYAGFVADLSEKYNVQAQDSTVSGIDEEGVLTFTESVVGTALDAQTVAAAIDGALAAQDFSPIEVELEVTQPTHTTEDISARYALMATFSTTAKNDRDRNNNIALALGVFDGMLVEPGQTVSFNATTGERTTEKGYKKAGVILNGVSAEDVGGGVCQVSSTLFNTVARAGLTIVERHPHTYPSAYIAAGLDAMVNWDTDDFIFTNNSEGYLLITTDFDWDAATNKGTRKLTFSIYGIPIYDPALSVSLRSEQYEYLEQPEDEVTLSDTMYYDELLVTRKGRSGSRWYTYRVFKDADGKLVSEEMLCRSAYFPMSSRMTVGTLPRGAESVPWSEPVEGPSE